VGPPLDLRCAPTEPLTGLVTPGWRSAWRHGAGAPMGQSVLWIAVFRAAEIGPGLRRSDRAACSSPRRWGGRRLPL